MHDLMSKHSKLKFLIPQLMWEWAELVWISAHCARLTQWHKRLKDPITVGERFIQSEFPNTRLKAVSPAAEGKSVHNIRRKGTIVSHPEENLSGFRLGSIEGRARQGVKLWAECGMTIFKKSSAVVDVEPTPQASQLKVIRKILWKPFSNLNTQLAYMHV